MDPETEGELGLPAMIQQYHSIYPLDDTSFGEDQPSQAFGVRTIAVKGISSADGNAYCLRRLDGRQVRHRL
jgi:PAB-dependent poly(A)-specific ribonuclease subunit 3